MVEVRLLGALEVIRQGETIAIAGVRQRRLITSLALRGRAVPREVLEHEVEISRGGLRTAITRLRTLLGPDVLVSEHQGYRLDAQVDVAAFEDLVKRAPTVPVNKRVELLEQAHAMWRGSPLLEVDDAEWAIATVSRLLELHAGLQEDLAEALLAVGRNNEAITLLLSNIEAHPYRDRPRGILMTAFARDGRTTEALRVFQNYRSLLVEDIGTDPSAGLIELDRSIAAGDPIAIAPLDEAFDPQAVELPTGLLSYMFTDIEGSTSMWNDDPEAMGRALDLHDEVILAAVGAAGGHVVKHTGDGFMCVFTDPDAAIAAAVDSQSNLELPVRMGIHCGTATLRGSDYFGACVSRAARLMSVAHPQQVLVSEDLAAFIIDRELLDLGAHQLKGSPGPEKLFQLVDSSLCQEFPALGSRVGTPNNLPRASSALVGRSVEVHDVGELVRGHRMVSLLGVGGAGKTRLSIQVAERLLDEFPDGVYMVELAGLSSDDRADGSDPLLDVIDATWRAVGLRESTSADLRRLDHLVDELRGRTSLLILDNCEHVAGSVAEVAERLVEDTDVRILATSRNVVGVAGEQVYRTPSLSLESAIELFISRTRDARREFDPSDDDLADIAAICEQLDRLPLAVELAAAQTIAMDVANIRRRLHRAMKMSGTRRTTASRHRTLEHAIGWSYETLEPTEKAAFARLSVFAGMFTIEAAEYVCHYGDDVGFGGVFSDVLGLIRKSLLETELESDRYRMLYVVREYGAARLGELNIETETRDRHAEYCLQMATQLNGDVYRAGMSIDASDVANLRAAVSHLLTTGDGVGVLRLIVAGSEYWSHAGLAVDVKDWLDAALALDVEIKIDLYVQALAAVASALTIAKPKDGVAIELARQAFELAEGSGASKRSKFVAASDLGYAYVQFDASDPQGREWLGRSLTYATDNILFEIKSQSRLSVAAFIGGQPELGLQPAERAVEIAEAIGGSVFELVARSFRAATRAVLGDSKGAREDLDKLEKLPTDLDPVWRGTMHVTAANGWLALGEHESAIDHLGPALGIPIDDIGEVICTMITSTATVVEQIPAELVAFAIGAVERYHSASQPMLRTQLTSARERAVAELGDDGFDAEYQRGQRAALDTANSQMGNWLRERSES